jgi:transcriptional regulator with XRE-family HTH domain
MKKEVKQVARQKIGEYLKSLREEKGISTYQMTKLQGIRFEAIQAIEEGSSNYTIDNFLTYISAIDCYFYLANRDGKHLDHDNMISKMAAWKKEKKKN